MNHRGTEDTEKTRQRIFSVSSVPLWFILPSGTRCALAALSRIGSILCLALAFSPPWAAQAARAGDKETVLDLKAILAPPLNVRVLKSTETDGIVTEEVMFHATKDGDKS